ncbi:oxygen-independent coproporphyrinogen III oxidase [Halomonas sp. ZH2S]|uniref:Coproporphyrinogen-III oxidase n=2 Tax=Vreelandella zhuhanensis TaxID=2684210 RepID=A0A7X3H1D6_9GAMM|nr:oxygen-independent coproporphyrinogen III oxidase [Halomonas zhuhanensis]
MPVQAIPDRYPALNGFIPGRAWNQAMLQRNDKEEPRYASYPTPRSFHDNFSAEEFTAALERSNSGNKPLGVYVHVPFCRKVCFYCACDKIVTQNTQLAEPYLSRLDREMVLSSRHLDSSRQIQQLHWGGTPAFLTLDQMSDLIDRLDARFGLSYAPTRDYSIDIDPHQADVLTLRHLQALGFNRISLSIQDFDPTVQHAINRVQPHVLTETLMEEASRLGFRSLSLDLIYGLPCQTRTSFAKTLAQAIELNPARFKITSYRHMPERFASQRHINRDDLPCPEEKTAILHTAITMLTQAGYVPIGLDHFVRPDDNLAIAQQQGTLQRNFKSYSSHTQYDLVGLGVSAVSCVDNIYAQNPTKPASYEQALDKGHLAIKRGIRLTQDDQIRRHVIECMLCDMALDLDEISRRWSIDAPRYLADALTKLEDAERAGLIQRTGNRLVATAQGRLLLGRLVMAFDAHSPAQAIF